MGRIFVNFLAFKFVCFGLRESKESATANPAFLFGVFGEEGEAGSGLDIWRSSLFSESDWIRFDTMRE